MVNRIKKSFELKRRGIKLRLFYSEHFFNPIRRFGGIKLVLENIFQKTLYLKNGESDQKKF